MVIQRVKANWKARSEGGSQIPAKSSMSRLVCSQKVVAAQKASVRRRSTISGGESVCTLPEPRPESLGAFEAEAICVKSIASMSAHREISGPVNAVEHTFLPVQAEAAHFTLWAVLEAGGE